jgi:hypothetical protein
VERGKQSKITYQFRAPSRRIDNPWGFLGERWAEDVGLNPQIEQAIEISKWERPRKSVVRRFPSVVAVGLMIADHEVGHGSFREAFRGPLFLKIVIPVVIVIIDRQ